MIIFQSREREILHFQYMTYMAIRKGSFNLIKISWSIYATAMNKSAGHVRYRYERCSVAYIEQLILIRLGVIKLQFW